MRSQIEHGLQGHWQRRGLVAWLLLPLAALYGLLVALHRLAYRIGLKQPVAIGVPVVVVGNLVAGGAGKTPSVMAVVEILRRAGWRPGIVSRGHGRRKRAPAVVVLSRESLAADVGDEPLLLHRRLGVPVAVGRDRVAAARALRAAHPEVNLVVCDDGLQHRRLARDVQVLVFDERGVGNRWLLPAGPLREPMPLAMPPQSVVLYNAPGPTTPWPGAVAQRRLCGAVALGDWWAGAPAAPEALAALRGRPLLAAAGLARPRRFFDALAQAGLSATPLALRDHARFDPLPWPAGTPDVIVTEKDAVKIDPTRIGETRVWVAPLDFEPAPAFGAALRALLPRRAADEDDDGHPTA